MEKCQSSKRGDFNLTTSHGIPKKRKLSKSLSGEESPVRLVRRGSIYTIQASMVNPNPLIQMRLLKHIQDKRYQPEEKRNEADDGTIINENIPVNSEVYQTLPIQIPSSMQLDDWDFDLALLDDDIKTPIDPPSQKKALVLQSKNDFVPKQIGTSDLSLEYPEELMNLPTNKIFRNISMRLFLQDLYDEQDVNQTIRCPSNIERSVL